MPTRTPIISSRHTEHRQEQRLHVKIPILKKNPTSSTACRTEGASKMPNASSSKNWVTTMTITDMDIDSLKDHRCPINFKANQRRSPS